MAQLPTLNRDPHWTLPGLLGWSTLPLKQGDRFPRSEWKRPAISSWARFQIEPPRDDEVEAWARNGFGVGVVTGAVSGIIVLDLDSSSAIAEAEARGLPKTVSVTTHKGRHLYFRHPGGRIGNRTDYPFRGADIRGDGGYVVAPGSLHPGGSIYGWERAPGEEPVADMPRWLLDAMTERTKPEAEPQRPEEDKRSSAYIDAAIDGELAKLRRAPEGTRNHALNKAAFALGQLAEHLSATDARRHLESTARAIGLDEGEIARSIASGWEAGKRHAREIPDAKAKAGASSASEDVRGEGADRKARRGAAGQTVTAADLMAMEFPPIKWVVPGYIPEGLTLLAGAPKIGKSWMALGLALAVAGGGKAFGEIDCIAGPVLYLALEDNRRRIQSRLVHMGLRSAPDILEFVTMWPTVDEDCVPQLGLWLDDNPDARLIVVDVFAKIKSAKGGNRPQYDVDYKDVTALQRLAIDRGVAIILVHHTRKMESDDPFDAVSGTRGLTGSADSTFVLTRATGQARPALYGRGRDIEEVEKDMEFDPATGRWSIAGPIVTLASTPERQAILDVIKRVGEPVSLADIADAVMKSKSNVANMLTKLVEKGIVRKAASGLYEICPPPGAASMPWTRAQCA